MLLLALTIAPGLAICLFIFYHDVYNREPALTLIMSFVWGMIAIIPAAFVEFNTVRGYGRNITEIVSSTYLLIALVEEFSKFLVLRYYAFTRKSFDEPLDGIVYSVMISMGFATMENVGYVFASHNGLMVALSRMFTTVPAHATFAVIMGYYVGKAKFEVTNRTHLLFLGVFWASFIHGTYDLFLFLNEINWVHQYVSELLLTSCAIISLYIALRFSIKLIRLHRLTSQKLFELEPVFTIRHASDEDITLIRELSMQVWPQTYSGILSVEQIEYMLDRMYSEASLHQQLHDKHQFLIVYNAGVPVGFASYSELEPTLFKLHKIYVLPIHQGRGTGRFIIEKIIHEISKQGAKILQLNVNRNNVARHFYEKLGFEVIGEEDINIGNGFFMNDYVMEKKIDFQEMPMTA